MNQTEAQHTVDSFNRQAASFPWCDFDILELANNTLVIRGALSQSYPPEMELVFERTFAVSLPLSWRTDTSRPVLRILPHPEAAEFNERFQVTMGNHVFCFQPEDLAPGVGCIVAAESFRFTIFHDRIQSPVREPKA